MTREELEHEISLVQAEAKSLNMKIGAISLGGSIAGAMYAANHKESFWKKVGWFFLGGTIVGIPTTLIFADKVADIQQRYQELKDKYFRDYGMAIQD
jgi:hypothetical protein